MDVWNMKLFLVLNRISHSFALLTREISWSTLEINSIFSNIHVLFSIYPILAVHYLNIYSSIDNTLPVAV